ncbi:hypothetical protein BV898_07517, partial [Hypsibius exemplaris]
MLYEQHHGHPSCGTGQEIRFLLNNVSRQPRCASQVSNRYPGVYQHRGLDQQLAVNMFNQSGQLRPGVAKVTTVFTDGH